MMMANPEEERASRQRVITSADDPRLQESRFKEAVAIVANNDARYQINKDRAKHYSRASGAPLRWAAAVDTATTEALQAELCDKEAKIRCGVVFVSLSSSQLVCMFSFEFSSSHLVPLMRPNHIPLIGQVAPIPRP